MKEGLVAGWGRRNGTGSKIRNKSPESLHSQTHHVQQTATEKIKSLLPHREESAGWSESPISLAVAIVWDPPPPIFV
jgi:hypothetical protein